MNTTNMSQVKERISIKLKMSVKSYRNESKKIKQSIKELIANSQDDEADALYTTFDSNEKKLKALEKRLSTKKKCLMKLDVKGD